MGRDARGQAAKTAPGEPRSARASAEKKKNPAASFIGGASAGLVSSALLQPFEVVKTKMQAEKLRGARGMVNVAADVVKTNGMKGLWSGVSASCVRTTAGAGLYFFLLERVTRELAASFNKEKATPFERSAMTFGAGCSARMVAAVLLNPITVVKTRMEYAGANAGVRQGMVATFASVARKEGAGGLFSGLGSTVARDAPFSGLNLLLFTQTRHLMHEVARMQNREAGAADTFIAGALAGAAATFLTHPPDVIRTRVQLGRIMTQQSGSKMPAVSLAKILREEGVRALWVGSLPRVTRRTLQQAITWSMFDVVSRALGGTDIFQR